MSNSSLPFLRNARANLAELIARLDDQLFPPGKLPDDVLPFILVDAKSIDRYLLTMADGLQVVSGGPATLEAAKRYPNLEAASLEAKHMHAADGSRLAPALARSWQMQRLDSLARSLQSLDDQIAKAVADEHP